MMKKAVIDVGSQSLRRLSFGDQKDLAKGIDRSVVCPLAKDLEEGYLKKERKEQALEILKEFCKDFPKEGLFLYATSAIREAKDGEAYLEELRRSLGIHVEILSGEEEASLGYEGVKLLAGEKEFSLVDLGGGSTEIVTPERALSIPMGVVRYHKDVSLDHYYRDLPHIQGDLYGIGGSLSVFVSLSQGYNSYRRDLIHGKKIKRETLLDLTEKLKALNLKERKVALGDFKGRAESILAGGKILLYLLEKLNRDEYIYSDYSNLEGYAVARGLL